MKNGLCLAFVVICGKFPSKRSALTLIEAQAKLPGDISSKHWKLFSPGQHLSDNGLIKDLTACTLASERHVTIVTNSALLITLIDVIMYLQFL